MRRYNWPELGIKDIWAPIKFFRVLIFHFCEIQFCHELKDMLSIAKYYANVRNFRIRCRPKKTSAVRERRGGLSSADIFRKRGGGVLQMRTSALFGAKNFEFFEIYGVSERTRGGGRVERVWTFCGQGGQFFAILCGRLLWTAPYCLLK